MVHRKTQRGRLMRKLKEARQELKRRMHTRLREQHGWLARVLRGHYAYYGVTGNGANAEARSRLARPSGLRRGYSS